MSTYVTKSTPNVYVKIRYSHSGPTQNVKLSDFEKIEDDFLPGFSKFDDGFVGYYHKDALCETPIRIMTDNGDNKHVELTRSKDGKFHVRILESA